MDQLLLYSWEKFTVTGLRSSPGAGRLQIMRWLSQIKHSQMVFIWSLQLLDFVAQTSWMK